MSALILAPSGEAPGSRSAPAWTLALLVLAVVWGGSIPLTKLGLRDLPPLTLTALRYLVAAPFFAVLLLGRPLPRGRDAAAAAGLGVLGIGVGQVTQTLGVRALPASVATVISALIPVFVVNLARIRFRHPVHARQAAGLAVAFAGVALVAGAQPASRLAPAGSAAAGDALMLASAIAVALYYVLSMGLVASYSAVPVAALSSIAGGVALAPASLWELHHLPARVTVSAAVAVLYLALLVTVAGMLVWFAALQRVTASVAAVLQYLQPLVGAGASAALFGERLGPWFAAGTLFVLVGIALTTGRRPRRREAGPWRANVNEEG